MSTSFSVGSAKLFRATHRERLSRESPATVSCGFEFLLDRKSSRETRERTLIGKNRGHSACPKRDSQSQKIRAFSRDSRALSIWKGELLCRVPQRNILELAEVPIERGDTIARLDGQCG